MTHAVFEPITLRTTTARNRLWVPPMCQYSALGADGMPTDWHLLHYGALARGGFGTVIAEATGISPEGRITPHCLGLWSDAHERAFARLAEIVHEHGALFGVQLQHAGRKASVYPEWGVSGHGTVPIDEGGWQTVAPSAIAYPGYAQPAELDAAGMATVVSDFAAAARRAVNAGLDLVEIHGAHGYLLHEFLSPLSNHRTDAYGGSLENRARLLLEVADAVRAAVGESVPVVVRLSATDWVPGGVTIEETCQVSAWLAEHGVDLINVSTGGNVSKAPIPAGPGYQVPFATEIRRNVDIPVAAAGLITSPQQAEQIVATGLADVAMIGREALRNPNFPLRCSDELGYPIDYRPAAYHRAYNVH